MDRKIKIDPEFKAQLFPLSADERAALEASILAEGCRDALVVWEEELILLDGHNRYEICEEHDIAYETVHLTLPDREAAMDWIDRNQIGRRNLTPDAFRFTLGRIYNRTKKANGQRGPQKLPQNEEAFSTAAVLAREHGVSRATVERAGKFAAEVEKVPELQQALVQGRSIKKVQRELKAEREKLDLVLAQNKIDADRLIQFESVCDIRACSCAELFKSGVKPDAVITDPPYPREFLPCFSELAEGCKAAGVPLVAVMSGQSYLPEVIRRLCEHMTYRWMLAYMTPGGQAVQQWNVRVNTAWKPVLLFGESIDWFGDVATSKPNDNDKRFHGWGQSESGIADIVERLTKPGQLVCDPFLGGGTTAVVSLALGRRFVGCDIDAEHADRARMRCYQ